MGAIQRSPSGGGVKMRTFLVDDRGSAGEYAHFLEAHREQLPALELKVFSSWLAVSGPLEESPPELVLLDMHFDDGPVEGLCGDIEALAASPRFGGDRARAEAQMRRHQGVFMVQALREGEFEGPIILFGSLPKAQKERLLERYAPLKIVEGLIFEAVRESLSWAKDWSESP